MNKVCQSSPVQTTSATPAAAIVSAAAGGPVYGGANWTKAASSAYTCWLMQFCVLLLWVAGRAF
jgi:hypothetical protein